MKKMLESGKIVNIHGLNGEVKAAPWCDSPDFLCGFDVLYLGREKTESRSNRRESIKIWF